MSDYNTVADGDDDSWPPLTQKSNPTSPLYSIWSSASEDDSDGENEEGKASKTDIW